MTACEGQVWVYFILCKRGIYIGVSIDPISRFRQHVAGKGAKSMRLLEPTKLLGALPLGSRAEALKVEYRFKRLPRARKLILAEISSLDLRWQVYVQSRGSPPFVFRYSAGAFCDIRGKDDDMSWSG
ncbi:GIY-YIG nuclease family protein [Luteimonas sp. Sa2BVA3]|uniref:GIY-YIG nuclease family protein n=1 Tax=Luteimonas colneyensis TaxID=2762230 RepID=A0ABR8UHW5_9GAMM|nr:GIY-YIG nuclease family protein [Luteimonas colneyensis]